MEKGSVLYHDNFKFKNGDTGQKLLVILNNPKGKDPYLCCKTTSKIKYCIEQEGCYSDKNIFVTQKKPFQYKTWIQFDRNSLFEISAQEFLQESFNKHITIIGDIDINTINALVNCIKKSEDISVYQLELLNRN